MLLHRTALALAIAALSRPALADDADTDTPRLAGIVLVTARQPSSLPTRLPTTIESVTSGQIESSINASDSEDALKYLPSLLVRKRYIGDHNHAVLSSRASGTGNSARSMVYADGILLSNYLGNGAAFTPRWGLVAPEEIERVEVLYGPFSAAYPGNSVGAVVDYVTRLPQRFEAHAKVAAYVQPFDLYDSHGRYQGWQASSALGDRIGGFAWWLHLNRLDSEGQPLSFANRLLAAGTNPGPGARPVSGAVPGLDKSGLPWWLLGDGSQVHSQQDHAKLKLAYEFGQQVRAQLTLGWWQNRSTGQSQSYLHDANGSPVYSGPVLIDGRGYSLNAADFPQNRDGLTHQMQGLHLARRSRGVFDWEMAASRYDYQRDLSRTPTLAKPAADDAGGGRITDLHGTGWDTLALKGVWRPSAAHTADLGLQQERYRWRQRIDNTADWLGGPATTPVSSFRGETQLRSLYAQDTWTWDPRWTAVLGLRHEHWRAFDGAKTSGTAAPVRFADRRDSWLSPKAALGWQASERLALKLSTGRAIRVPTVGELFQGNAGSDIVTNPNLKPEQSWTTELSAEFTLAGLHRLRTTLFHERTSDALYSQAIAGTNPIVNSVQNIDRLRTLGFETAFDAQDFVVKGLDAQASLTHADSVIVANSGYVGTPGDTLGKQQPRVPKWRASLLLRYQWSPQLSTSVGARYGSRQYGQLNNSDTHGDAFQGFSPYLSSDLRLLYRIDRQWRLALGIDNLNNDRYWNFHPYPQRSYSAELSFTL